MFLVQTIFVNGKPVGRLLENIHAGRVTFKPKKGHSSLAGRKWKNVVSCQRAVIKSYTNEGPLK